MIDESKNHSETVTALVVKSPGENFIDVPMLQITPAGQPNVRYQFIGPITAIFVRAGNAFWTALSGGLGLTGLSELSDAHSLQWVSMKVALAFAGSAALASIITSMATLFSDLEKKYPILRA